MLFGNAYKDGESIKKSLGVINEKFKKEVTSEAEGAAGAGWTRRDTRGPYGQCHFSFASAERWCAGAGGTGLPAPICFVNILLCLLII